MSRIVAALIALCLSSPAFADVSGCMSWPVSMAQVHLKNAGLLSPGDVDGRKITGVLLARQPLKDGSAREVYDLVFPLKSGRTIQVITSNLVTKEECSGGPVDVYIVSKVIKGP